MIKFTKLYDEATIPARAKAGDAGFDVSNVLYQVTTLKPGERHLFPTGIAVSMPSNHYCRVEPRSGLAVKHGIDVLGGVIDSGYDGEIMVCLINHGDKDFVVSHGDRIAQLVFKPILTLVAGTEGPTAERGSSGFGSTGK